MNFSMANNAIQSEEAIPTNSFVNSLLQDNILNNGSSTLTLSELTHRFNTIKNQNLASSSNGSVAVINNTKYIIDNKTPGNGTWPEQQHQETNKLSAQQLRLQRESYEERGRRLKAGRERMRLYRERERMMETADEREKRLSIARERTRLGRSQETTEQRERRLKSTRERLKLKRQMENQLEREHRLRQHRESKRESRYHKMSAEERAMLRRPSCKKTETSEDVDLSNDDGLDNSGTCNKGADVKLNMYNEWNSAPLALPYGLNVKIESDECNSSADSAYSSAGGTTLSGTSTTTTSDATSNNNSTNTNDNQNTCNSNDIANTTTVQTQYSHVPKTSTNNVVAISHATQLQFYDSRNTHATAKHQQHPTNSLQYSTLTNVVAQSRVAADNHGSLLAAPATLHSHLHNPPPASLMQAIRPMAVTTESIARLSQVNTSLATQTNGAKALMVEVNEQGHHHMRLLQANAFPYNAMNFAYPNVTGVVYNNKDRADLLTASNNLQKSVSEVQLSMHGRQQNVEPEVCLKESVSSAGGTSV